MLFEEFFYETDKGLCVSQEQGSRFAKEVAGDFNPIHDPGSRRFCVPGDLLFALVLKRFGLSRKMSFRFHSMVGGGVPLVFDERGGGQIVVEDSSGKICLEAEKSGGCTKDSKVIDHFTRRYVAFSGLNFPHYLKPLMEANDVMFNPSRPLVFYDSMGFELDSLDVADADLEFHDSKLEINGKRAAARLEFRVYSAGNSVGAGSKKLLISGLRPYSSEVMDSIVREFCRLKDEYEGRAASR